MNGLRRLPLRRAELLGIAPKYVRLGIEHFRQLTKIPPARIAAMYGPAPERGITQAGPLRELPHRGRSVFQRFLYKHAQFLRFHWYALQR
jgi:hypothetical protein